MIKTHDTTALVLDNIDDNTGESVPCTTGLQTARKASDWAVFVG